jgi:predicted nucleic acid-binding Zn finger protein
MLQEFSRKRAGLLDLLKKERRLTDEVRKMIVEVYGKRGERAIEAVEKSRVIRRGRRWFVRGRGGEYEVVKNLCSCPDYMMNIATGKAGVDMCYHALARFIAEITGGYRDEKGEDG